MDRETARGENKMIDYTHVKTILFPEGPAKAKIISVKTRQRRDPEEWRNRVDTLIIELAVIHAGGPKDIYEDSIPITRTFACRIDELRKALGETLPADDDPARAKWNEETAIGKTVFILFTVWQNEKKSVNKIKYLLPAHGLEVFRAATNSEGVSA
jgi:hypothetical protein